MSDISFPTAQPLAGSRPSGHADHGVVALVGPQAGTDSNWALLRVHGADATTFLHAQLSQDVIHMSANTARLAAWCNAKGRMVASCVLVREQVRRPKQRVIRQVGQQMAQQAVPRICCCVGAIYCPPLSVN